MKILFISLIALNVAFCNNATMPLDSNATIPDSNATLPLAPGVDLNNATSAYMNPEDEKLKENILNFERKKQLNRALEDSFVYVYPPISEETAERRRQLLETLSNMNFQGVINGEYAIVDGNPYKINDEIRGWRVVEVNKKLIRLKAEAGMEGTKYLVNNSILKKLKSNDIEELIDANSNME